MSSVCAGTWRDHQWVSAVNDVVAPYVGLVENGRLCWVQSYGQQARQHLRPPRPQLRGVLGHGNGMQVDNGIYHRVIGTDAVLQLDPLLESAEIVSQMRNARGLDAGKDDLGLGSGCRLTPSLGLTGASCEAQQAAAGWQQRQHAE